MKCRGFAYIGAVLLFCTGCAARTQSPAPTDSLHCRITGQYTDIPFEATAQRVGIGTLILDIEQPKTVSGLRFVCQSDGTVLLQLQTLEYTALSLPTQSLPVLLCAVLDDVTRRTDSSSSDCITGKVDGKGYQYCYDKDGLPLSLSIPEVSLYIAFSNI